MNMAFYILLLLAVVALWFMLPVIFKPVGGFILRIFQEAKETMFPEEKNIDNEKELKDNE